MKRSTVRLIVALALLAAPLSSEAQRTARVARLGGLLSSSHQEAASLSAVFQRYEIYNWHHLASCIARTRMRERHPGGMGAAVRHGAAQGGCPMAEVEQEGLGPF
jgi:hypothetical protein